MSLESQYELPVPTDGELIVRVRHGDSEAYGELFTRHHCAALRLARQLAGPADADDLVSEAFTRVYNMLRRGGGPDIAFRAYLLTAVRRLHVDRIRAARLAVPTEDIADHDAGVPFDDPAIAHFENAAAARAFRSLPERWQVVLWHLEVEAQKPAEIAPLLGMTANGVSALGYRAREGLRQAYLRMHLVDSADEDCRWVTERLGARVRNGLSRRDQRKVDDHLDSCRRCSAVLLELNDINSSLAGVLGPVVLGTAAAGYLTATGAAAGGHGVWALLSASRHAVGTHGMLTAGSAAASVVAVAVGAALLVHHLPIGRAVADTPRLRSEVFVGHSGTTAASHPPGVHRHPGSHSARLAPRPSDHAHGHNPSTAGQHRHGGPSGLAPTVVPPAQRPPGDLPRTLPTIHPTTTRHSGPPTHSPGQPPTHPPSRPPTHSPTRSPTHSPSQPPTKPPHSTPPGQVDISMSRSSAQAQPRNGQLEAHLRVDITPATPVDVTVTMSLPEMSRLRVAAGPWHCDPWPPSPQVTEYTCTITAAHPPVLNVQLRTVDHASPWIRVHATGTGVVDSNPANNGFVWQP